MNLEMFGVWWFAFLITVNLIIGTFGFYAYAARKRHNLKRKNVRLPATITGNSIRRPCVNYKFNGQVFSTSPLRYYAIRRKKDLNVWVSLSGGFERIDVWTENWLWAYYIAASLMTGAIAMLWFVFKLFN